MTSKPPLGAASGAVSAIVNSTSGIDSRTLLRNRLPVVTKVIGSGARCGKMEMAELSVANASFESNLAINRPPVADVWSRIRVWLSPGLREIGTTSTKLSSRLNSSFVLISSRPLLVTSIRT